VKERDREKKMAISDNIKLLEEADVELQQNAKNKDRLKKRLLIILKKSKIALDN
jgi:c-di-GMP-binding flagellar brake protein YcgR